MQEPALQHYNGRDVRHLRQVWGHPTDPLVRPVPFPTASLESFPAPNNAPTRGLAARALHVLWMGVPPLRESSLVPRPPEARTDTVADKDGGPQDGRGIYLVLC